MALLLPFSIRDKIIPYKCVVIPQFGLKFELICLNFVLTPWISQTLPNFQSQFSQKKEEVGSNDNIALNQRCIQLEALVLSKIIVDGCFGKTTLAL